MDHRLPLMTPYGLIHSPTPVSFTPGRCNCSTPSLCSSHLSDRGPRYRTSNAEVKSYLNIQHDNLARQLTRMERWGGVRSWTVALCRNIVMITKPAAAGSTEPTTTSRPSRLSCFSRSTIFGGDTTPASLSCLPEHLTPYPASRYHSEDVAAAEAEGIVDSYREWYSNSCDSRRALVVKHIWRPP